MESNPGLCHFLLSNSLTQRHLLFTSELFIHLSHIASLPFQQALVSKMMELAPQLPRIRLATTLDHPGPLDPSAFVDSFLHVAPSQGLRDLAVEIRRQVPDKKLGQVEAVCDGSVKPLLISTLSRLSNIYSYSH